MMISPQKNHRLEARATLRQLAQWRPVRGGRGSRWAWHSRSVSRCIRRIFLNGAKNAHWEGVDPEGLSAVAVDSYPSPDPAGA